MKQSNFFEILGDEKIEGTVEKLKDGTWQAKINGGWWIAIGATKESAIKAVTNMFKNETENIL